LSSSRSGCGASVELLAGTHLLDYPPRLIA
jgi:hypothetical protein